jgi:protein-disulfide isomerase
MASRKNQREELRARRIAAENARLEQARRRRLLVVGGTIAAALVVLVAGIAISSSGSGTALKKGKQAQQTVNQVQRLLAGIPQSGARLGDPKAPVTLVYYGDLQCSACRAFALDGGLSGLIANDVRSGKVQVVYRGFETATPDPRTFQTQQVAALAAGQQSHFWDFTELFYHQQGAEGTGYVTDSYLAGLASQIPGFNMNSWHAARHDPSLVSQVVSEQQAAGAAGIKGTPTLVFRGPKGSIVVPEAIPSYAQLQQVLQSVA